MPTYEYECKSCKRTLEVHHGINDPAPATCDNCGGELRRIFYPPGLVFKGTGFYSTEGRFGRTADKRSTSTSEEGKSDAPDGKKERPKDTAASVTKAEPATRAGTEKSA